MGHVVGRVLRAEDLRLQVLTLFLPHRHLFVRVILHVGPPRLPTSPTLYLLLISRSDHHLLYTHHARSHGFPSPECTIGAPPCSRPTRVEQASSMGHKRIRLPGPASLQVLQARARQIWSVL